jgi:hypothetical protein
VTRSKPATAWRARSRIRWASAAAALGPLLWIAAPAPARSPGRGADGQFETRTSAHFELYQDVAIDESGGFRGSRRFEQAVLDELEHAYDDLDTYLALRPARRLEVLVYDPGIFDASFGGLFRFPAAGFYGGVIRVRGDTQLTVQLARVLHHELVHAAYDAAAPSLVLPAWFNEGVAEWFEARSLGKRRLSGGELGALVQARQQGGLLPLPTLSTVSFSRLEPSAASLAYVQSYGMIEYLARHYGDRALRDFSAEVVRSRDLDRSMRRVFRIDLLDLEAGFVGELD